MYCIDASVIVSAQLPHEVYFQQSRTFLAGINQDKTNVLFPELVIPEIASGLFRETNNPSLVFEYIKIF